MGKWTIIREGRGANQLQLVYKDLSNNQDFNCGRLSAGIPDEEIVDWILIHSTRLANGDFIQLSSGKMLRFFNPHARA